MTLNVSFEYVTMAWSRDEWLSRIRTSACTPRPMMHGIVSTAKLEPLSGPARTSRRGRIVAGSVPVYVLRTHPRSVRTSGVWSGRTDRYGSGNRGTTATTLQGNAQSYGRWEMKLRTVTRTAGPRYLVRAELVPELATDYDCGAHNITIAEIKGGQSTARIGATRGTAQWTRSVSLGNLDKSTPMVAVGSARVRTEREPSACTAKANCAVASLLRASTSRRVTT